MPKFVEYPKEGHEVHTESIASWEEKYIAYQTLTEECRRVLPFRYFCETQYRGKSRGFQRIPYHNFELRNSIGIITLPCFDGTSKFTMSSSIQKIDTYFQLNPMAEKDAIKLVELNLHGVANDWWFHGMKTLGHRQVVTYEEFTRRLVERFDRRVPDIYFHELAHIRQVKNLKKW